MIQEDLNTIKVKIITAPSLVDFFSYRPLLKTSLTPLPYSTDVMVRVPLTGCCRVKWKSHFEDQFSTVLVIKMLGVSFVHCLLAEVSEALHLLSLFLV